MSVEDTTRGANGTRYQLADHERRLLKLEDQEPEVLADRVARLAEDVKSLKRAALTFASGIVLGAVIFAFSVFELLGQR
ncbi:MAG: hypothetical protein ACRDZ4_04710 [Egibacteraceae bacterium]